MRKRLVAANWKMNGDKALVSELLGGFKAANLGQNSEVVIFAPAVFIPLVEDELTGSVIKWGGQNCSEMDHGAFTGEISLSMLKAFGCTHVLVGHSERRTLYSETNGIIAEKVKSALAQGVTPVLCVGETLEQRESGITETVVAEQINAVLDVVGIQGLAQCVIAYEPVWAIGTGKTATPDQAQEVHAYIRQLLASKDVAVSENIQILYGGSVNGATASELFGMPDIDGGLVGGASLKQEEFITICKAAD